jgi:hypothetical protein
MAKVCTGAIETPEEREDAESAYRKWVEKQARTSAPSAQGNERRSAVDWAKVDEAPGIDAEGPDE